MYLLIHCIPGISVLKMLSLKDEGYFTFFTFSKIGLCNSLAYC